MEQRRERADERQPSPSGSRLIYFAVPATSRHMFRTVEIRQALLGCHGMCFRRLAAAAA
ncbi:hypothetical protein AB0N21_24615 [Streptomyces sp. NPDC051080]|uniref:hypothetical protein n=1 Tax=Streptomyces sp. NPDC051080 TaxID=3157222 RepID=UPI00341BBAEA